MCHVSMQMSVVEDEFKTNSSHLSADGAAHLHNFLGKVKQDLQKPQTDKRCLSINNLPLGRRLHLDQDGVIVDSMIEQMDSKIEELTKRNQDMLDQITNRLKTGNKKDAINSILQSFFDVDCMKINLRSKGSATDPPSLDYLNI